MSAGKQELIEAVNASVREMQQGIEVHTCLVRSILDKQVDEQSLQTLMELCPSRKREQRLKEALCMTIEVLEESRKAFKSKKLEALRKDLTHVLIQAG